MSVIGSGFAANTYGSVFFDINRNSTVDVGEPVQYLTTSSSGTFTTTVVVPSTALGAYPIVAIFGGLTGSTTFTITTTGSTGAGIALSPASGMVGTTITIVGNGFAANTYGSVFFDINRNAVSDAGEPIQYLTTSATGTFTTTMTVPSAALGAYPVVANFAVSVSATFSITTTGSTTASIVLTPTSGPTGTVINIAGSGFANYANVGLFFDINRSGISAANDPVQFVSTSSAGTFSATLTVPSVATGAYQILAAPAVGQATQALATFTVTP